MNGLLPAIGYIPILHPLPVDDIWLALLLPLVVVISVVYKTIKLEDLSRLPKQASMLSIQIIGFMILAALVLWVFSELL
ncbi:MAG: hypothetical protein CMJ18_25130 [Phycisphaeraceae bacterium]|nr:hypothetical protein [Phycisphaeraceae bacterium]